MPATAESESMTKVMMILRRDHANFEHLLECLTHVADLVVSGEEVDLDIVRAGAVYYRGYVATLHHPLEDLIYGHLRLRLPGAVNQIFPVAEDHRHYRDWVVALLKGLRNYRRHHARPHGTARSLRVGQEEVVRENFCLTIREFVSHMRAHMHNEAPLLKLAGQNLRDEDWREIARSLVPEEDAAFENERPKFARLLRAVFSADVSVRGRLLQRRRAA